jgi:hypothetical protein
MTDFKPTAYIRTNCPYSFKFLLFVTEAGLQDRFDFVPMNPEAEEFVHREQEIEERMGRNAVFPLVEVAAGEFMSDSDNLIDHFSRIHNIDSGAMFALKFYRGGLYLCYLEMFSILATPLGWLARLGKRPKAFR